MAFLNKARKGWSKERQCRDELKIEGWNIVFKSVRFKYGCVDFANLFDVVAYKQKDRKFISVKSHADCRNHLSHQIQLAVFKETFGLPGESFELWIWKKARYIGRGKNKHWENASWTKIII